MFGSYTVEVVHDRAAVKGLYDDWNRVAPPRKSEPWQGFSWIDACADTCSSHSHLDIITVRRDGELTAAAPLVLRESNQPLHPLRLEFLGGDDLKEPNRFVASDPASLALPTDQIVAERTYPIRLSRIPNDSGLIKLLRAKFRMSGWLTKQLSMPYPYLKLNAGTPLIKKSFWRRTNGPEAEAARWDVYWTTGRGASRPGRASSASPPSTPTSPPSIVSSPRTWRTRSPSFLPSPQ